MRPAHLAGPFDRAVEAPRSLQFRQQVSILGRGRFDNGDRHTVFLHVGSRDMQARLKKPDYPDAIPHLSLYNGRDKQLADLLYGELGKVKPFSIFHSKRLEVVESKQQFSFNFRVQVDPRILRATRTKSLEDLRRMSFEERVGIALSAIQTGFAVSLRRAAMKGALGHNNNHR